MAERYVLGRPTTTTTFIQYPACKDVNILAQFGLVDVIFTEVPTVTSPLQICIRDCNTNTFLYKEDSSAFLSSDLTVNTPYNLIFKPSLGGYLATVVS